MSEQFESESPQSLPDREILAPISVAPKRRRGFLPFSTNTFDRVFISVVCFVAVHLLWMRFLEPDPPGLSLYIATVISVVLGVLIITRG